ncbi:hypothetical protein O3G_MSEX008025 [Manduca sexta]|uniref:Uncharacterized protein n=1 Tax=Manduca sexta TaxID=7130 RepID=A0A921Z985_MANSE|nr:hypothetical protein O3G_MSEX008025 [Manduca sexta]
MWWFVMTKAFDLEHKLPHWSPDVPTAFRPAPHRAHPTALASCRFTARVCRLIALHDQKINKSARRPTARSQGGGTHNITNYRCAWKQAKNASFKRPPRLQGWAGGVPGDLSSVVDRSARPVPATRRAPPYQTNQSKLNNTCL